MAEYDRRLLLFPLFYNAHKRMRSAYSVRIESVAIIISSLAQIDLISKLARSIRLYEVLGERSTYVQID